VSVSNSINGDDTLPQRTTVAAVPKVAQRWKKSTKQLATLGPSSSDREMIEKVC
jgi:pyruvate kinase